MTIPVTEPSALPLMSLLTQPPPFCPGLQLSCLQYYMGPYNVTVGMELDGGCMENPKYYNYVAVLSLIATIMLVQVSHMVKLTLMLLVTGAVTAINLYAWCPVFDEYDHKRFQEQE